jgi:hypothetical protein
MNESTIKKWLILAGLANISGVLIFSKFFTNEWINKADPVVMSNFGLLMIVVWGLAYIASAGGFQKIKWLMAVFAFEKLIYVIVWINWIFYNDIRNIYHQDVMAGVFYSIYGLNDLIFMIFFILAFFQIADRKANPSQ